MFDCELVAERKGVAMRNEPADQKLADLLISDRSVPVGRFILDARRAGLNPGLLADIDFLFGRVDDRTGQDPQGLA